MAKKKVYGVSGTCFQLVMDSEGVEGEDKQMFTAFNTEASSREVIPNITKETVVAFLECDETEVYIVPVEDGHYDMVAYNSISKEAIRVSRIGHHFVALIETVKSAKDKIQEREGNPNCNVLTHRFIKKINEQLMIARYGEVAIGDYRTVDFLGRDVEVVLGRIDADGNKRKIDCVEIETSKDGNVVKKMDELVKWTNEKFKSDEKFDLEDVAEFHARFIKIHPFRDGNGRTARLLTNYLLLVAGYPMINISPERKKEYYQCLNYANTHDDELFIKDSPNNGHFYDTMTKMYGKRSDETKYIPLARYLKGSFLKENNKSLINNVINYRKEGAEMNNMNVCEILSPYYAIK
jgi:fido (protein-threonine AMPylation protein)